MKDFYWKWKDFSWKSKDFHWKWKDFDWKSKDFDLLVACSGPLLRGHKVGTSSPLPHGHGHGTHTIGGVANLQPGIIYNVYTSSTALFGVKLCQNAFTHFGPFRCFLKKRLYLYQENVFCCFGKLDFLIRQNKFFVIFCFTYTSNHLRNTLGVPFVISSWKLVVVI